MGLFPTFSPTHLPADTVPQTPVWQSVLRRRSDCCKKLNAAWMEPFRCERISLTGRTSVHWPTGSP